MQLPQLTRRLSAVFACALLAGALAACSSGTDEEPTPPANETETAATATEDGAESATATSTEEELDGNYPANPSDDEVRKRDSETAEASATNSSAVNRTAERRDNADGNESDPDRTGGDEDMPESVADAYEIFSALAPREMFTQFISCDSAGLKDSYNCSGPGVGQFQFFKSDTKAAQTTQVLTELRSSHVVEDSGSRVVGWSTLGSTAVLTVVDNDEGLVMQQMVSTDQVDPKERLEELGLI